MVDNELTSNFVFGALFKHSFGVLDRWGDIVDSLLYNNKYFSSDFFQNISTQYTTQRDLMNPDTGDSLRLSSDNLIFTYYKKDSFEKSYGDFSRMVCSYLIPEILSKYGLIIRRIGLVFSIPLNDEQIKKYSSYYFNDNVQEIGDFRFSFRETTKSGKLLSGVNDYYNTIITIGNINNTASRGLIYDQQIYFDPLRADIRDIGKDFLNSGKSGFLNEVNNKI